MTEPRTEAGRAHWASLDDYGLISSDAAREAFGEDILAIEQQAAAAEAQRLRRIARMRYEDLRDCNKDQGDDCHIKAEGAWLVWDDLLPPDPEDPA